MTHADPVTPELRRLIFHRDRQCVAAILDRGHQCRDQWGEPCDPHDERALTIEHVKSEPMMGKRAPSDTRHLVVLCHDANTVSMWGSAHRDLLRAYLAGCHRMRFTLPYVPPGSNQLHRMHWSEVAAWRRQVRDDVTLLTRPISPLLHSVRVGYDIRWSSRRSRDATNYVEALKPALDALVGRWLVDDDRVTLEVAGTVGTGEPDHVVVTVEEET
jgi:hypothetical protein